MLGMFIGMMIAYAGGNTYIFIRGLQTLSGCSTGVKLLFSVIYWCLAGAMFLYFMTRNIDLPKWLAGTMFSVGSAWLIFTLYMVIALVVTDVAGLFLSSLRHGFVYALGFTLLLLLAGYCNYRHPKVVELNLTTDKHIEGGEMKIVAISDVHLGDGTGKKALQRYVRKINAQQPDLILIGGDLIDNSIKPVYGARMNEELEQLKATLGIYMVPGNHEYISGLEQCEEFLRLTDITLLRDSVATLPNGVQIIGRDDRSNKRRKTLENLIAQTDKSRPIVVIDHQPYKLAQADSLGVDLQFSGHTHHGQVWPISMITDRMFEQSHGYRKWSHAHIYVSSGLSLWGPPFRIGTNSDMAVIRLTSTQKTE